MGRKEREEGREGERERGRERKREGERERNTGTRPQPVPPTTTSESPPQQYRWRPTQTQMGPTNNSSGARKPTNTRPKPSNSLNKHNYKEMNSRVLHHKHLKKDFSPEIKGKREGAGTEQGCHPHAPKWPLLLHDAAISQEPTESPYSATPVLCDQQSRQPPQ